MNSWGKGRTELFEQLSEIYDRIGRNVANELNDENHTRISREELRLLQDSSVQAERLVEDNSRLQDELDKCRAASTRVVGLEKENQRLATELDQALKQQAAQTCPESHMSRSTPIASSEPTSPVGSEPVLSNMVSREKHRELVLKYNAVCLNYHAMREAKTELEGIREADKANLRRWNAFKEEQDARIGKKDERILRLREEVQKLRHQLKDFRQETNFPLMEEQDVVGQPGPRNIQLTGTSPKEVTANREKEHADHDEEEELPLPFHRNTSDIFPAIEDTQFEDIEHRQSSSTSDSDPISEADQRISDNDIKLEPSEDVLSSPSSLILISSRAIRRGNPKPRKSIKTEALESSPVGLAAINDLNESIDLDDIGEKVDTPRKRKRALELSRRISALTSSPTSSGARSKSQDHSSSTDATEVPSERTPTTLKSSVLQPRSVNAPILPRTSDDRAAKKRRIADDQAVGSLLEDGEFVALPNPTDVQIPGRLDDLLTTPSPKKQALTPARLLTSGNPTRSARALAPSRLVYEVRRDTSPAREYNTPSMLDLGGSKRGHGDVLQQHSSRLTTTSRELVRLSSRDGPRTSAELARPPSRGAVSNPTVSPKAFLRESSPFFEDRASKGKEASRLTDFFKNVQANMTPVSKSHNQGSNSHQVTPNTSLPTKNSHSRQSTRPSAKRHFRLSRGSSEVPDVHPDQEPLRLRSVQSLTLGDFKINPNHSEGYGYAYSEVIRGKDARQCLQGCTKPACCGLKFRALVEGMRDPNKPLTASQEEADRNLLNEFLGRDAYKVQNMTKEERDEMILQAKTREYANKHGKHRHAFERTSSPPGFWRADWPSTQEELADRAKAKEKDRLAIEERYREAMRGGRYIFRDE